MLLQMYIRHQAKHHVKFSAGNETNSFERFSKNTQVPNFMKIRIVETKLLHSDTRTDTTKLTVIFRKFAKALKNNVSKTLLIPVTHSKNVQVIRDMH